MVPGQEIRTGIQDKNQNKNPGQDRNPGKESRTGMQDSNPGQESNTGIQDKIPGQDSRTRFSHCLGSYAGDFFCKQNESSKSSPGEIQNMNSEHGSRTRIQERNPGQESRTGIGQEFGTGIQDKNPEQESRAGQKSRKAVQDRNSGH